MPKNLKTHLEVIKSYKQTDGVIRDLAKSFKTLTSQEQLDVLVKEKLKTEEAELLLSTRGLSEVNKQSIIDNLKQIALSEKKVAKLKEQISENQNAASSQSALTITTAELNAQLDAETKKLDELNKKTTETLSKGTGTLITQTNKVQTGIMVAISSLFTIMSSASMGKHAESEGEALGGSLVQGIISGAMTGLMVSGGNPWGALIGAGAGGVLSGISYLIGFNANEVERLSKQAEQSKQAYEETTNSLKELESELKTTQKRLQELYHIQETGSLSVVQKQEIKDLSDYNDELERRQSLEKILADEQLRKAGIATAESLKEEFNPTMPSDGLFGFMSDYSVLSRGSTLERAIENYQEYGSAIENVRNEIGLLQKQQEASGLTESEKDRLEYLKGIEDSFDIITTEYSNITEKLGVNFANMPKPDENAEAWEWSIYNASEYARELGKIIERADKDVVNSRKKLIKDLTGVTAFENYRDNFTGAPEYFTSGISNATSGTLSQFQSSDFDNFSDEDLNIAVNMTWTGTETLDEVNQKLEEYKQLQTEITRNSTVSEAMAELTQSTKLLNTALAEQVTNGGTISKETYANLINAGEDIAKLVTIDAEGYKLLTEEAKAYGEQITQETIKKLINADATEEQLAMAQKYIAIYGEVNDSSKELSDGLKTLSDAFKVQINDGELSADAVNSLREANLESVLVFDSLTNSYTISESKVREYYNTQITLSKEALETTIKLGEAELISANNWLATSRKYGDTQGIEDAQTQITLLTTLLSVLKGELTDIEGLNTGDVISSVLEGIFSGKSEKINYSDLWTKVFGSTQHMYDMGEISAEAYWNAYDSAWSKFSKEQSNSTDEWIAFERSQLKNRQSGLMSELDRQYQDELKTYDNMLSDKLISADDYYQAIEKLREKYYGAESEFGNLTVTQDKNTDLTRSNQEKGISTLDSEYKDEQSKLDKQLEYNIISLEEYWKRRNALREKYLKLETDISSNPDITARFEDTAMSDFVDERTQKFAEGEEKINKLLEKGIINQAGAAQQLTELWEKYYKDVDALRDEDYEAQRKIVEANKAAVQEQIDALESQMEINSENMNYQMKILEDEAQAINDKYDDMISPLQEQLDLLDKQAREEERKTKELEAQEAIRKNSQLTRVVLGANGIQRYMPDPENQRQSQDAQRELQRMDIEDKITGYEEQRNELLKPNTEAQEKLTKSLEDLNRPLEELVNILKANITDNPNINPDLINSILNTNDSQAKIGLLNSLGANNLTPESLAMTAEEASKIANNPYMQIQREDDLNKKILVEGKYTQLGKFTKVIPEQFNPGLYDLGKTIAQSPAIQYSAARNYMPKFDMLGNGLGNVAGAGAGVTGFGNTFGNIIINVTEPVTDVNSFAKKVAVRLPLEIDRALYSNKDR